MRHSTSPLQRKRYRERLRIWRRWILLAGNTILRVSFCVYLSRLALSAKHKDTFHSTLHECWGALTPVRSSYVRTHWETTPPRPCGIVFLIFLVRIRQSSMDLPWTSFQTVSRIIRKRLVSPLPAECYTWGDEQSWEFERSSKTIEEYRVGKIREHWMYRNAKYYAIVNDGFYRKTTISFFRVSFATYRDG